MISKHHETTIISGCIDSHPVPDAAHMILVLKAFLFVVMVLKTFSILDIRVLFSSYFLFASSMNLRNSAIFSVNS